MRNSIFVVFFISISLWELPVFLQTVPEKSKVSFTIKNFGVNTNGTFKAPEAKVIFDPAALAKSSIDASIDVASVNTGVEGRDNHLRKQEYFYVEKYPKMTFQSTQIRAGEKSGSYIAHGRLTIRGITKEIDLPFSATTVADGMRFETQFQLDRRQFKVGGNSLVMSDNVNVSIILVTRVLSK
ncbi:MAG: YceI family protein [Gemmatimonadaceae bacterium]|nr:YceI family protein [Chitinophagaceae bacterium]